MFNKNGTPTKEGDIIDFDPKIYLWQIHRDRHHMPSNSDVHYHLKNEYKELIAVAPRPQYLPRVGEVVYGSGTPWIVAEVIHDLENNEYHIVVNSYPKKRYISYGSREWHEPVTFLLDMKENMEETNAK